MVHTCALHETTTFDISSKPEIDTTPPNRVGEEFQKDFRRHRLFVQSTCDLPMELNFWDRLFHSLQKVVLTAKQLQVDFQRTCVVRNQKSSIDFVCRGLCCPSPLGTTCHLYMMHQCSTSIHDPLSWIIVFNPFQVPLLNTIVLISSGIRVTWAHHALMEGNFSQTGHGLWITVILGVYFTFLQGLEYYEARFSFADGIYGSTFFIATGFHGLHVIVGTIFLGVSLYRHASHEFRRHREK